jgi:CRP-like cAMP-binding protein
VRDPAPAPHANALFASLSLQTKDRLRPHVREARLEKGRTIQEIAAPIRHAYFPLNGLIALLTMTDDADAVEVAMIGSDGAVGPPPFSSTTPAAFAAVVQVSCDAYRLSVDALLHEFRRGEDLQTAMIAHADWLIQQVGQSAACQRYHSLTQRLCRWLLSMRETLHSDTIDLTQEAIAQLLGLSRPKVSVALANLEDRHYIHSRHGRLRILQPRGLEACSCACQRASRGSLLSPSPAFVRSTPSVR